VLGNFNIKSKGEFDLKLCGQLIGNMPQNQHPS
jgi:hypothetical protein